MFERYTEKARRVIFFARYEASQFGSPNIETEHLLLGMLREDKTLTNRFLRSHASVESIRNQIEANTTIREKVSTSVDLPLSNESKRVLAYAAEEAERLANKHIGTEHLLLGLLREEKCLAAQILGERGLKLAAVREEIARMPPEATAQPKRNSELRLLAEFGRDLTQAATDNPFEPVSGRDKEIEALLEVLCSYVNKNPVLIYTAGAVDASIVESLAQLIADGHAPACLEEKHLLALSFEHLQDANSWISNERLRAVVTELMENPNYIVFMDEIHRLPEVDPRGILKRALSGGEIQCIGASTRSDYEAAVNDAPWLGRCFRSVTIPPLREDDVIRSLSARKPKLEKFHGVSYLDETLPLAVQYAKRYFASEPLLEKAMEILDVTGARIKLRQGKTPAEVLEVQKRIKFIAHRMEAAIANHEFEKARFYSDEERKHREELRILRDKYNLGEASATVVGPGEIAGVVSRWTGYPVESIQDGSV